VNHEQDPDETRHKIRMAFGNGLRPDIWPVMKQRFRIPEILEFYGSTEGNVSIFNFDGREGAVGRAPKWLRSKFNIRLVQFDVEREEVIRGPDGFCIECGPGQIGECIGEIGGGARGEYSGYLDRQASEKKVLTDVFSRGDAFFATGDLMRMDSDGYLYFVDRIGDTFRWKGENVATTEVEAALAAFDGIEEAVVYGVEVPGADGRAGMAAIRWNDACGHINGQALADYLFKALPKYAVPLFIRVKEEHEVTATFKHRKVDLKREGYNPELVKEDLYELSDRGYVPINRVQLEARRA
jgi:fatty-acyl-CoA synthase